jgi:hypothetical protein
LVNTTTGDTVRVYHAGSVLGSVVDLLLYPTQATDSELGAMIKKIKGQWKWATATSETAAKAEENL